MENKTIIENFLRGKGLNDMAIAGVMGNIQQESNFSTTATNKSSGAYGLFQWTGSRKTGLKNFAFSKGTSESDINTQLEYFWHELNTTESKTKNVLFNSNYSSASDYAVAFENSYERSGGSALDKRKSFAEIIFNAITGKANTSTNTSTNTNSGFSGTSGKFTSNIGLQWWGDIVVVVFAILLLVMGVAFVGLAVTSNKVGSDIIGKITKGGGKND